MTRSEELPLIAPAVTLIVGALVAFSNYAVQRWRFKVDRLNVAIDHLSIEVNAAADLGTVAASVEIGLRRSPAI